MIKDADVVFTPTFLTIAVGLNPGRDIIAVAGFRLYALPTVNQAEVSDNYLLPPSQTCECDRQESPRASCDAWPGAHMTLRDWYQLCRLRNYHGHVSHSTCREATFSRSAWEQQSKSCAESWGLCQQVRAHPRDTTLWRLPSKCATLAQRP